MKCGSKCQNNFIFWLHGFDNLQINRTQLAGRDPLVSDAQMSERELEALRLLPYLGTFSLDFSPFC